MEEWVRFRGNGRELDGYLSLPEEAGEGLPAVVVLQEIWGLDGHIKDVARRFASEGFAALAPDLYTGEWNETLSPERVSKAMGFIRGASQEVQRDPEKLQSALAKKPESERDAILVLRRILTEEQRRSFARDALGAVEYLKSRPEVDPQKIGSLGFCMGGGISGELAALAGSDLSAAVIFYGQSPAEEGIPKIQAPVLGLYGGKDPRITGSVPALEEKMRAFGKDFTYHVYPQAPHAFFNDTRQNYREEAAKDAWRRVLEFFGERM